MEVVPPDPPDPPDFMEVSPSSIAGNKRRLSNSDDGEHNGVATSKKTIVNRELASASIQSVYLNPKWVVGIQEYTDMDKGPFIVQIARSEPDPSAGTTIRPIKFGQFLFKNKISNIVPDGVKRVGRNKISVEFNNPTSANNFVVNPVLAQSKYTATIPTYNITRMGLVRNVPVEFSMDELVESLSLPPKCGEILKARRMNRKVVTDNKSEYVPTQTVVITFYGQFLPEKIYSFHTALPVEKYIYPTIQCMACCRFGHIKAQCRSKLRCFKCGQEHLGDSCVVTEADSSCLYCLGKHFATSKSCPEQDRQKELKMIMAREGISYEEASRVVPHYGKRYSDIVQSSPNNETNQGSPSPRNSYAKTVYTAPRPRPTLGKTYDRVAHNSMVAPESSTMPNGCALLNPSTPSHQSVDNNSLLQLLLSIIVDLISQKNLSLPSNVASKLTNIMTLLNHNGSSNPDPMEHSKHTSKET